MDRKHIIFLLAIICNLCLQSQETLTPLQLKAFKHYDFWQPMDTLREKIKLEQMWQEGNPPWKVWNN